MRVIVESLKGLYRLENSNEQLSERIKRNILFSRG